MANFSFDVVSDYDKAEMNNVFDQVQRERLAILVANGGRRDMDGPDALVFIILFLEKSFVPK